MEASTQKVVKAETAAQISRECLALYDALHSADARENARRVFEAEYWLVKNHYLGLARPAGSHAAARLGTFRSWLRKNLRP